MKKTAITFKTNPSYALLVAVKFSTILDFSRVLSVMGD